MKYFEHFETDAVTEAFISLFWLVQIAETLVEFFLLSSVLHPSFIRSADVRIDDELVDKRFSFHLIYSNWLRNAYAIWLDSSSSSILQITHVPNQLNQQIRSGHKFF